MPNWKIEPPDQINLKKSRLKQNSFLNYSGLLYYRTFPWLPIWYCTLWISWKWGKNTFFLKVLNHRTLTEVFLRTVVPGDNNCFFPSLVPLKHYVQSYTQKRQGSIYQSQTLSVPTACIYKQLHNISLLIKTNCLYYAFQFVMPVYPHDLNLSSLQPCEVDRSGGIILLIPLNWWEKQKLRGIKTFGQGFSPGYNTRAAILTCIFWIRISFFPTVQYLWTEFSSLKYFIWVRCQNPQCRSIRQSLLGWWMEMSFYFLFEMRRKGKEKKQKK